MRTLLYRILLFIFLSLLVAEDTYFEATSSNFTIDRVNPTVQILSPEQNSQYFFGQSALITWLASDDTPLGDSSISILLQADMGSFYYPIPGSQNITNSGSAYVNLPNITTSFAQIIIIATDLYGNSFNALSNGYFTIGNPADEYIFEDVNTEISGTSPLFMIDTKDPEVQVLFPNEETSFIPTQQIMVTWAATDDNLIENPIRILLVTNLNSEGQILADELSNTGEALVQLPYTNTSYAQILVRAFDSYGYKGFDLSDNYFSIGPDQDIVFQDTTVVIEELSQIFTIDSKDPIFDPIDGEDVYFYPNGGELLSDYSNVALQWHVSDDSHENLRVIPEFAYLLGGWYTLLDTMPYSNIENTLFDLTLNGIVDSGIWGRMRFRALDYYGNQADTPTYNDSYFTLGSTDGDISADLYDEETLDMFVGWTWENKKHRIVFTPNALSMLNTTDQILIVDEEAIYSSDCLSGVGMTELATGLIQTEEIMGMQINTTPPIIMNAGVNHCSSGGGILTGYTEGDSIRVKIISSEGSYYLRPSQYGGSLVFNNQNTVIKEFNQTPYQVGGRNNSSHHLLTSDGREWDEFNVYGKVTFPVNTHLDEEQSRESGCDNDGVCDSSELLAHTTTAMDCLAAGGQWDSSGEESFCYIDYNGDGMYSPEEFEESVGTCINDCCETEGTGDNVGWCFIETVNSESYSHSLVNSNYIDVDQGDNNIAEVSYRVWLLDNEDPPEEIYKTYDVGVELTLEEIPEYIKPLGSGWSWISLNVNNDDMSITNIFSNTNDLLEGDFIKGQTMASTYYSSYGWYPANVTLDILNCYLLDLSQDITIAYNGSVPNPEDVEIPLSSGWNWISYIPTNSYNINDAFENINLDEGDFIKGQTLAATYYSNYGWYPGDVNLEPTTGYLIKTNSEHTLIYPDIQPEENNQLIINTNPIPFKEYKKFENNSFVTLELKMDHLTVGKKDKISIYKDKELRGVAYGKLCPVNDKILFNLMVYSNKETEQDLTFVYYNNITGNEYFIRETINFEKDDIRGNVYSPFTLTDMNMPYKYELQAPYPNPFNPTTTIKFSLMDNQNSLNLSIYDIRGRLVENIHSGSINYGYHTFKWDASRFSSGIYFVHMVADEHVFTKKITLLK